MAGQEQVAVQQQQQDQEQASVWNSARRPSTNRFHSNGLPYLPIHFSVLAGDPGRLHDAFGTVLLDVWRSRADAPTAAPASYAPEVRAKATGCYLRVREAWQFRAPTTYEQVAERWSEINRIYRPDIISIESNHEGAAAAAALEAALPPSPPVQRIACTGRASVHKQRTGAAFEKARIVEWLAAKHRGRLLGFRPAARPEMAALRQQLTETKRFTGVGGTIAYRRDLGRHDDLASALYVAAAYAWRAEREWRERESVVLSEQAEKRRYQTAAAALADAAEAADLASNAPGYSEHDRKRLAELDASFDEKFDAAMAADDPKTDDQIAQAKKEEAEKEEEGSDRT